MGRRKTYFLLEPLVPFCHFSSSSAASLAACCAAFWSAASALRAMPAARLVLSLFLVLPMVLAKPSVVDAGEMGISLYQKLFFSRGGSFSGDVWPGRIRWAGWRNILLMT